jgi:ATP-dependent DNA ligase
MTQRLLPMLAVAGRPFSSEEYLFEVKWDGVRALATVDADGWQLWGRQQADYASRYPELEVMRQLPSGTTLDGELVVLRQGRPDLAAILQRHGLVSPAKIRQAATLEPVLYIVFDLLRLKGESICGLPLFERRRLLADLLACHRPQHLVFSEGICGNGEKFFAAAVAQGQEGIMAKQLGSRYLPGRRSSAWQKIKPAFTIPCLILGYQPYLEGAASLLVAAEQAGQLKYVARLRSGFTDRLRVELGQLLGKHQRSSAAIACPSKAVWVEPKFFCQARFLQWTAGGRLRGASFAGLLGKGSNSD